MKMHINNQQGSAHVVLVVILVVTLIASLGWIFWQNFIYKEPGVDNSKNVTSQETQKPQDKKSTQRTYNLVISQWGLGGNYDTSVGELEYKIEAREGNEYLYLVNPSFDPECSVAAITRYSPDGRVPLSVDGSQSVAAKDYSESPENWKKIDNYFYQYSPQVQALCGPENMNQEQAQQSQNKGWGISREFYSSLQKI